MKPMKGVIANWHMVNDRVEGTALWHKDGTDLATAIASPSLGAIANGHGIYTSPVLGTVFKSGDFEIVETRNSYYVLLGAEKN